MILKLTSLYEVFNKSFYYNYSINKLKKYIYRPYDDKDLAKIQDLITK